jgi:maltose O-acetyltransferase
MQILRRIYKTDFVNRFLSFLYVLLRESHDNWKYKAYRKKYNIDPTFKFRGTEIIFFGNGNITIKENSYIVRYSILESCAGCKIIIGKNCSIGPYVKMYTYGKLTDQDLDQNPFESQLKYSKGDIIIGDGCWIGANVGIKGGVTIGKNAIIGMNSVVTKNIPPHCVAVGSPARVVKFKPYLSEKEKKELSNKYLF